MALADIWVTIGGVAAVAAALLALVTVWFARQTITEARQSRKEGEARHGEILAAHAGLVEATTSAGRDAAVAAAIVARRV